MAETFTLNATAESFKKLAVAAYASTIGNNGREIYQYVLIKDDGKDIISYGTNGYMAYKSIVRWSKGEDEISDGFRVCLKAEQIIDVAKSLNKDSNVSIRYDEGGNTALCTITSPKSTHSITTTDLTIFEETKRKHFPEDQLKRLLIASSMSEKSYDFKVFDFVLLEKMCKHIKTAISSQRDRKHLHIKQYRTDLNRPEVFEYQWFSALIMPIKS